MDKFPERIKRWRIRAEELRTIADGMETPGPKQDLYDTAFELEELALQFERLFPSPSGRQS
jgi:hypothetical protein